MKETLRISDSRIELGRVAIIRTVHVHSDLLLVKSHADELEEATFMLDREDVDRLQRALLYWLNNETDFVTET